MLGVAMTSPAVAQQQTDFPRERTSAASCADIDWNENMLLHHPSLINACQEVVSVEGEAWARFAAKFVRMEPDGKVVFSVRDRRDRSIDEVAFMPVPGQMVDFNGRAKPFSSLRTTDSISLYVPEGQYGFATQPGAPREQIAKVVDPADSTRSTSADRAATATTTDRTVAQRDTRPSVLPTTAGPLPWLALAGFLSILGGLGLTLRRRI
ncbi:MAG: hypothetical protein RQ826_02965 [Xanthomonadales bacterium]|nr:hypothetical protein [Xanthomonadales bacterium]